MDDPIDSVSDNRLLESFEIQNIGENVGTIVDYFLAWFYDVW